MHFVIVLWTVTDRDRFIAVKPREILCIPASISSVIRRLGDESVDVALV
jgi:hypothetical protein